MFIRNRKPRERTLRKALKQQLQYVERNLVRQQRQMYSGKSHSLEGRIVSISKPHVRAIVRGKARVKYEFGAKLLVSLVDGLAEVDRLSWEAYNECQDLKGQIGAYRK